VGRPLSSSIGSSAGCSLSGSVGSRAAPGTDALSPQNLPLSQPGDRPSRCLHALSSEGSGPRPRSPRSPSRRRDSTISRPSTKWPLDELEPPDLWREASIRPAGDLPPEPQSQSARVAVVLVSAVVALAGVVFVIRAFGDGPNVRPAGDVTNGKIAVAREGCEGDVLMCREPAHIVLVNPDGSGELDIGEGSTPAWSSDGSRLAYTAGDAGAIYVVDADGARKTSVVSCDEPDCVSVMSPTWSPDGTQLAFMVEHTGRSGRDSEVDIWVVNADGRGAHAVTACRPPDCSSNFAPAWSPVGDEIAMWSMVRCGDGRWGPSLRLLDVSTGDIRDVASCVRSNGSRIAWSPDGRLLAFELDTGNGTGNIFTIRASGGSSTQVTFCDRTDCRWAYYPSWSPRLSTSRQIRTTRNWPKGCLADTSIKSTRPPLWSYNLKQNWGTLRVSTLFSKECISRLLEQSARTLPSW
jgi:Tol biopolymer transport system component